MLSAVYFPKQFSSFLFIDVVDANFNKSIYMEKLSVKAICVSFKSVFIRVLEEKFEFPLLFNLKKTFYDK